MKNLFLCTLLLFSHALAANNTLILSDEFVAYHLKAAIENIEEEDIFELIQENINNLTNTGTTDGSANELINLIEEGYRIDPFNMAKLIEILTQANASNNATKIIIKAINHGIKFGPKERKLLVKVSNIANARKNVEKIRHALHERETQS